VSNRGTPLQSGYLSAVGLSSVNMVADRHNSMHWRRTS